MQMESGQDQFTGLTDALNVKEMPRLILVFLASW